VKQKNILCFVAIALFASPIFASIDCGPAKIIAIQSQNSDVLIEVSIAGITSWKALGLQTSNYTKSFQAIAQQALASDLNIVLRYPDGYDCMVTNFGTPALMIRITK
jgi:hypothetical protein